MNESHRRAILYSVLDIHHRLAEMEAMLAQSRTASALRSMSATCR